MYVNKVSKSYSEKIDIKVGLWSKIGEVSRGKEAEKSRNFWTSLKIFGRILAQVGPWQLRLTPPFPQLSVGAEEK